MSLLSLATRYSTEHLVAFICSMLSGRVQLKKVMLLAFLAQHEFSILPRRKMTIYTFMGEPLTRARFYIWHGIQSDEIYSSFPPKAKPWLPKPVAERVLKIVRKHGRKPAWKIERYVLKKLSLYPYEKLREYTGTALKDYLKTEKFKIIRRELTLR